MRTESEQRKKQRVDFAKAATEKMSIQKAKAVQDAAMREVRACRACKQRPHAADARSVFHALLALPPWPALHGLERRNSS